MKTTFSVLPQQFFAEGAEGGGAATPAPQTVTHTQEAFNAIITERLARQAEKFKDYDAVKTELAALKTGAQTEAEKITAKLAAAEAKAAAAEAKVAAVELDKLKVAALEALGLPASWASRIGGTDAASVTVDAKAFHQALTGGKVAGGTAPPAGGAQTGNATMNKYIRQVAGRE